MTASLLTAIYHNDVNTSLKMVPIFWVFVWLLLSQCSECATFLILCKWQLTLGLWSITLGFIQRTISIKFEVEWTSFIISLNNTFVTTINKSWNYSTIDMIFLQLKHKQSLLNSNKIYLILMYSFQTFKVQCNPVYCPHTPPASVLDHQWLR